MKYLLYKLWFLFMLVVLYSVTVVAQGAGDYRTATTGQWSSASTWQMYNGSAWVNAGTAPTGSEVITVQSTDSVYFDIAVSISGLLINQGKMGGVDNLTIGAAGIYQHDQDGGDLPRATWDDGSTLLITGSTGSAPSNGRQDFYNVIFNTPGQLSNLNLGWDSITIRGDITVVNTGSARWQMAAPAAGDSSIFSIMGNVIVTGGAFSSNGTSNANTKIEVHQYGNIIVTGGNFSVSRGSQGSGTGSTRWFLHEGDFSMMNATTQNSNQTNAWFVFDKSGTQTLTLGAGNTLTSLPIEVASGTTLDMGTSQLRGSGIFRLDAGATLATGSSGGLDTALQTTGARTIDPAANYIFNGSVAQSTGFSFPATVNDLTIDNASGVTLSQTTTINGILHLMAGVFDNTIPFILGPGATVSEEGGSLAVPLSVELGPDGIPTKFFVEQNYPNPFNPSTIIRFGLPKGSVVSAKVFNVLGSEVATLFDGKLEAGVHELDFRPGNLGSGVYICRIQAGSIVEIRRMILMK